ncbi:dynein axonemal assembly factor 8 [Tachysurus ichikawai]
MLLFSVLLQLLLTLALFKPGVWSHYLLKIQQNSFTLVGLRILVLNSEIANTLINRSEHQPSVRDLELMYLTSGPVLALCLQRVNAVKKLLELLGPEDPVQARNVQDLHFWRPAMALTDCITASMKVLKHEQIPCLRSDPVASLKRQPPQTISNLKGKKHLFQPLMAQSGLIRSGCSVRSALCQTTCLIMPSRVLQLSRPPLHLDLLQRLLSSGRHVVDGRNCSLDPTQITHLSVLLIPSTGKALKESLLPEGPRLVLALQTDNIVTCFDSILKR